MELSTEWRKALTAVNARLKEVTTDVAARGLDKVMEDLEDLLVSVWEIENRKALRPIVDDLPVVNQFVAALQARLHKMAPPPPKKVKRDTPPRKILPLSEAGAVRALDVIMLLRALVQIGDYTQQTDKARTAHRLFLDDWRRMFWDSARIPSWDRLRQMAAGDPPFAARIPTVRFSRQSAVMLLDALSKHRADLITPIPTISMIACQGCGRFEGRERVRCSVCDKLFCGKCFSREGGLCLTDYAVRYLKIPAETRTALLTAARGICRQGRLDEYTRNASFVKALAEQGVEVVFHETAPDQGEEVVDNKGKISIRLRDRENAAVKKALFAALARSHFRTAAIEPSPELEAYFVDICMGVPIEETLSRLQPAPSTVQP